MKLAIPCLGLMLAMLGPGTAAAKTDILAYFRMYYSQQVAGGSYKGPLDFLADAAAGHADAGRVLTAAPAHAVTMDRTNGYLQIADGSGTDQALTMAVYRKADSSVLLVVGSSNCADGCTFLVQFFVVAGDRLRPLAAETVLPVIEPAQFIKPGQAVPPRLANLTPAINYVPARVGTNLTLKPWYGYEVEEQMDKSTRAAIRDVVLTWDRRQGRFVTGR